MPALALLALGCAGTLTVTPTRDREPVRKLPSPAAGILEPPVWVPAQRLRTAASDAGVIADGVRMSLDGRETASMVADRALVGSARAFGADQGHWFFGGQALYRARSFLGPLEPVFTLPAAISSVRVGPDFTLLQMNNEGVVVLNPKSGALVPPPWVGLYDVATLSDGRALALVEPGRVLARAPSATEWKDVSRFVLGSSRRLTTDDEGLWVVTESDGFRLESNGTLTRRSPPVKPRLSHANWPLHNVEPLDHAVQNGWRLDRTTALTIAEGRVVRISLHDGAVVSASQPVLPADARCTFAEATTELLAACRTPRGLFVATGLTGVPRVERSFGPTGHFAFGHGRLLFAGPCEPSAPEVVAACIRSPNGSWQEVKLASSPEEDSDDDAPQAGPTPGDVTRFVLAPRGTPLALITAPTRGLIDLKSGLVQPYTADGWRTVSRLFEVRRDAVLLDDVVALEDFALHGYSNNRAFALAPNGEIQPELHKFSSLASSGAFALGLEHPNSLWQSTDHGRTFTVVGHPHTRGPQPTHCSHVGCALSSGLHRIGWRESDPTPRYEVAPKPVAIALPGLPRLSCSPIADPVSRATVSRIHPATEEELDVLELGAHRTPRGRSGLLVPVMSQTDSSEALRATWILEDDLSSHDPGARMAFMTRRATVRYVAPLLPQPSVAQHSLTWLDVANRAQVTHDRLIDLAHPQALAVGEGELGVEFNGIVLVLGPKGTLDAHALPPDNPDLIALARADGGQLLAWLRADRCDGRIEALAGSVSHTRYALPSRDDDACGLGALGLRGDDMAIIRTPASIPPSPIAPAYAVSSRGVEPLAHWSTLTSAAAPECRDHNGYRVVLAVPERWLDVHVVGAEAADGDYLLISGTWSAERLCVRSLEAAAGSVPGVDSEVPARVVARLHPNPAATRVAVALGMEWSGALSCRLSH